MIHAFTPKHTNQILIVAVYVDDIFIFTKHKTLRENIKRNLQKNFEMKDLGTTTNCLGINITRNVKEGKLWIDQRDHTEKILRRFNMMENKPVSTLLETGLDFLIISDNSDKDTTSEIDVPYQEAISSLLYLPQISRPDIAFATSLLSRFNNNYIMAH